MLWLPNNSVEPPRSRSTLKGPGIFDRPAWLLQEDTCLARQAGVGWGARRAGGRRRQPHRCRLDYQVDDAERDRRGWTGRSGAGLLGGGQNREVGGPGAA